MLYKFILNLWEKSIVFLIFVFFSGEYQQVYRNKNQRQHIMREKPNKNGRTWPRMTALTLSKGVELRALKIKCVGGYTTSSPLEISLSTNFERVRAYGFWSSPGIASNHVSSTSNSSSFTPVRPTNRNKTLRFEPSLTHCISKTTEVTFGLGDPLDAEFEIPLGLGEELVVFHARLLVHREGGGVGVIGFAGSGERGLQALRSGLEKVR